MWYNKLPCNSPYSNEWQNCSEYILKRYIYSKTIFRQWRIPKNLALSRYMSNRNINIVNNLDPNHYSNPDLLCCSYIEKGPKTYQTCETNPKKIQGLTQQCGHRQVFLRLLNFFFYDCSKKIFVLAVCDNALGLSDARRITDAQLSASSDRGRRYSAKMGRLFTSSR